jgi:V-type H+-transporting ATPase subunit a
MKISLIFGLVHMVFGVSLSSWNRMLKRKYASIFLEWIPQLVFLVFVFCYLIFLIFFKWITYHADTPNKDTNPRGEHCAPNLLITFINMMLFKGDPVDEELQRICQGNQTFMFPYQDGIQKFLVVFGFLMIPIMLFGMPIHTMMTRR